MTHKILLAHYIALDEKMMQTFDFTIKNYAANLITGKYFSVLEKNKPPNLFLRGLKILPSRTALSVIESRSKPTSAVSKNIILMITTKLFVFSHDAHVCSLRREVPNDCMTS